MKFTFDNEIHFRGHGVGPRRLVTSEERTFVLQVYTAIQEGLGELSKHAQVLKIRATKLNDPAGSYDPTYLEISMIFTAFGQETMCIPEPENEYKLSDFEIGRIAPERVAENFLALVKVGLPALVRIRAEQLIATARLAEFV